MNLCGNQPSAPAPSAEWDLFANLLPSHHINTLDPRASQAAYTPWIVVWLLIYQRLHGNASLNDAVSEFTQRFPSGAMPDCKRAREHSLSSNTGTYSLARTNLDVRVLRWAADNVYRSLLDGYPASWNDRRVFLLDGSTVQLAATKELQLAFPPASNQYGNSHWPILHLVFAHELASGLGIFPAFGPMYGPGARSELSLAQELLQRLPAGSIVLGDRNFGVFACAWAARQGKHDVLWRLSKGRFKALRKKAKWIEPGKWELTWRPSAWDRKQHPELPEGAEIKGTLVEVQVSDQLTLWLFTTLSATGEELASLYHKRQDVETDIRNIKETLKLGEMTSKSVAMVEKDLAAAVIAYNLVNQVRRLAAQRAKVEPRRLSFAGVWSLLKAFAAGLGEGETEVEAQARFERLLRAAGQRKLPQRRKHRSYPRQVIARRRKFPTRKRPQLVTSQ